jgi:hypothetical protein
MDIEQLYEDWLMISGQEVRHLLGSAGIVGARDFKDFVADRLENLRQLREAKARAQAAGGKAPPPRRPPAPPAAPEPPPEG